MKNSSAQKEDIVMFDSPRNVVLGASYSCRFDLL